MQHERNDAPSIFFSKKDHKLQKGFERKEVTQYFYIKVPRFNDRNTIE